MLREVADVVESDEIDDVAVTECPCPLCRSTPLTNVLGIDLSISGALFAEP
jgi:hypothetical protein